MLRKTALFAALVLLMVLPFSGVSAQMDDITFCGDLSEADCELVTQSQEAMMGLESFAFSFDADFSISGLEMAPGMEELSIGLVGEGAFAADLAMLGDMADMSTQDAMAMMEDMEGLGELFATVLRSVSGEITLEIILSDELLALIGEEIPELVFDLVMLDGVAYLDVGPLMSMGAPEPMSMWMGIDVAALYEGMFDEMGGEMDDAMSEFDMSALFEGDLFATFADPEFIGEFVSIARLDDVDVMGQSAAVFETNLDYGALFASEALQEWFADYMNTVMEMTGEDMEDMPPGFMDMMLNVVGTMFADSTFRVQEWIGLDDHFVHHGEMEIVFNLDLAAIMEMMGEEAPSDMPQSMTFALTGNLDLSGFNEPLNIVAPEGAQVIDPAMFLGGMGDF